MPDEEQKPAEMSFSDWKKMKSALNSSTENKTSKAATSGNAKSNKNSQLSKSANPLNKSKQTNNNINNNRDKNLDYRQQQTLQYFESLKQNQSRMLNNAGNMGGFLGNQMLMMQTLNNIARNNCMGSYSNNMGAFNNNFGLFNNNAGPFGNNMGPFNNNMGPFNNNMGPFNNNMGPVNNNMNQKQFRSNARPKPLLQQAVPLPLHQNPFRKNQKFTENYMGKSDDFQCMSDVPIPQQPFKQNKNIPSLMSIRTQKRGVNGNNKGSIKKANEVNKTNKAVKANSTNTQTTATVTATASPKKSKALKQKKEWPIKPPMPPPINALTPEAQEAKARMWREYRQKIKPFKNKDFLNAKRVIQRLKKKPYEELDERDKERWEKANEFVNSHKKMLSERAMSRGEAASARATRVQEALNYEKNFGHLPPPGEPLKPLDNDIPSVNYDDGNIHSESSYDAPLPSGAAGTSTASNNWELWNSFVPGGVLFKS